MTSRQEGAAPSSSSADLSSLPSSPISPPGSPSAVTLRRPRPQMGGTLPAAEPAPQRFPVGPEGKPVQLTAAGLPRKKPGRKPGTVIKPKVNPDGTPVEPKTRRPRKPRDPNAPPPQRKRKTAPNAEASFGADSKSIAAASTPEPAAPISMTTALAAPAITMHNSPPTLLAPSRSHRISDLISDPQPQPADYPVKAPRRTPSSMQNILNDDFEEPPRPARSSGAHYDPIRGNYDPVRETMVARDPYGISSPRATATATQMPTHASASPSIASLVDPVPNVVSPQPSHQSFATAHTRVHVEPGSVPASPSHPRPVPPPLARPTPLPAEPTRSQEVKEVIKATEAMDIDSNLPAKEAPVAEQKQPELAPQTKGAKSKEGKKEESKKATKKGESKKAEGKKNGVKEDKESKKNGAVAPVNKIEARVKETAVSTASASKKGSSKRANNNTAASSPNLNNIDDILPSGNEQSILDFGKARPGEELQVPDIMITVPIKPGETNVYVNFRRMAEDKYGWDALNPRQAANRDRRARIAAAASALEKATASGRETGDEMTDNDSDNEEKSDPANGQASGVDGPAKPVKKKRVFKEDEYDRNDDFVDDSELLWEEQAAAVQDGFFVYSGPLVPEVEKPATPEAPKRGRGRGGRSRGGSARGGGTARGGSTRGGSTGRGGGPGSRGGTTRKPRGAKAKAAAAAAAEQEQSDKDKAAPKIPDASANPYGLLQPTTPLVPVSAAEL